MQTSFGPCCSGWLVTSRRESHALAVEAGQVSLPAMIKERPGITAQELADREQISAPAMSAHLGRLEAADLAARERALDRRRMELYLTPQGERVLRSVRKKRTAWLAERLEQLEPRERVAIEAAIGPLARLLEVGK